MDKKILIFSLTLMTLIVSCEEKKTKGLSAQNIYTLYKGGVLDKGFRIHIATFETLSEGSSWNKENCEKTSDFMNEEEKMKYSDPAKFWCEKGEFKE